jgi:hypothetical protein
MLQSKRFSFGLDAGSGLTEKRFVTTPPTMPMTSAANGLKIAYTGPSMPHVAMMLSMPVWGVEIRKDIVAPFDAFPLRNDIATGSTPQEHNGSGIPKIAAFTTDMTECPPRCLRIKFLSMKTWRMPAKKSPSIM